MIAAGAVDAPLLLNRQFEAKGGEPFGETADLTSL